MIWPGVQKPHWKPSWAMKAACTGCEPVAVGQALDGQDLGAVEAERPARGRS